MKLRCNFCSHTFTRSGFRLEYRCPKCREFDVEPVNLVTVNIPHLRKASKGPAKPPVQHKRPSKVSKALDMI